MSVAPTPVVAVAAVAENGVIGRGPDIPWRIPGEQQRFKELTMGGVLVMGRRTYDSIGRPLPGRVTVVITRDRHWSAESVLTAGSVSDGLALARQVAAEQERGLFVAGGGEVYRQTVAHWDRIELTRVHQNPPGDVFFPDLGPDWRQIAAETHGTHSYLSLIRRRR